MKKLLIAMALSALMLSGCGMFRSHKNWEKAQQENPLEIPPDLDRPSASAALVIPPPVEQQVAAAPVAAPAAMQGATSLHLADDVDTAYRRVGQALERGDLGTVSAQDDAAHSFQLEVRAPQAAGESQGFFQKHFSNAPKEDASAEAAKPAGAVAAVTVRITADDGGGSTVAASGDPRQSERIISVLKGRLGG